MTTPQRPLFTPSTRASRGSLLAAALAVVTLGAGGYLWLRQPEPMPATARVEQVQTPRPAEPRPAVQISGTDPNARELLRGLSSDAEYLRWLSMDDLARRFVSATNAVAEGQSPRLPLSFLAPAKGFQVVQRSGRTVIAPESYARFDGVARALDSVDTRGVQRVYAALKPLLNAAHAEIAPPGRTLDQALGQAIHRLTGVAVPTGPVEVTAQGGALYTYADPRLEALSPAEKHLLRLGPDNMRKVQAKLSEIALELGLPSPKQARR